MSALRARVGRVVRRFRKARGLTLEQLAEAAGLHRNFVGLLERGGASVAVDALERLTATLGVSLGAFFTAVDAEAQDAAPPSADSDGGEAQSPARDPAPPGSARTPRGRRDTAGDGRTVGPQTVRDR